jgi:alkyl sulfatase BDS1-like metallo-beta-lactamase superfamily hydrolase
LAWSKYIHEAIDLWGADSETMFASHHWPRFGNEDVRAFLAMQRDAYRWMHDQTMRLANRGHVPTEIADELSLPASYDEAHIQGYYGTVSHNVRSVYNRYLGWYDGNPANLDPLPPVDAGGRYVEFMGGADAVLDRAQACFDEGDYRWVAQVVNHVVFADPTNQRARQLQADALEQLGYQSESATWRNAYLMGAQELRQGSPTGLRVPTRDLSNAMNAEQIIDTIGVRFDPAAFGPAEATINLHLSDLDEDHVLGVSRSTIHHSADKRDDGADVSVSLTRAQLMAALGQPDALPDDAVTAGDVAILTEFLAALDIFEMPAIIEP